MCPNKAMEYKTLAKKQSGNKGASFLKAQMYGEQGNNEVWNRCITRGHFAVLTQFQK